MMGLDIVGWLDVVGMSHMVSCVMTKRNNVFSGVMDRSRDGMMNCVMDRSRDGMMNCVTDRSRDG